MHGSCGACPSPVGSMHTAGTIIGVGGAFLCGLLTLRGTRAGLFRRFPLFYSYLIYSCMASVILYVLYWRTPSHYASVYWINYLVSILAEFMVLVEISDQIFCDYPAIRGLGRGLTILISGVLGLFYVLPPIMSSSRRSLALLGFSLRAYETKAIILLILFYLARHYGSPLGRNVGGLMIGFSVYVALNVALMSGAKFFGPAVYGSTLWVMEPVASLLCMAIWTASLWNSAPIPISEVPPETQADSEVLALRLTRFNTELSKILHK